MVRYACESDIPRILVLAAREHSRSPWSDIPFDLQATEGTIRSFLMLAGRTLLVTPGGYLAGLVQPLGFSNIRIALEYAWYAEDGRGLDLLAYFERWAHTMGAARVITHNYTDDARLPKVLALRRGYTSLGEALSKRLEH
jgi:hypothetical protein